MRLVLMYHFGRSGSTVLGRLLNQHPRIIWDNEPFTEGQKKKGLSGLTENQSLDFLRRRIDWRLETSNKPNADIYGFEIKEVNFLEQVINSDLNSYLHFLSGTEYADFGFVTLRRINTFKRLLSAKKSAASGVAHIKNVSNESASSKRIKIPINRYSDPDTGVKSSSLGEGLTMARHREKALLDNILPIRTANLFYEDDILNDPREGAKRVAEFLHVDTTSTSMVIDLAKTSGSVRNDVENFDEVQSHLRNYNLDWMLEG